EWDKEVQKSQSRALASEKEGYNPSLLRAILRTFGSGLSAYGFLPFAISKMVKFFSSDSEMSKNELYACRLLYIFCTHNSYFGLKLIGMRIRVACSALLYRK
ncbi:ATP-binding cassette sub-family C member 4, partial [Caligus rogercresseyi]